MDDPADTGPATAAATSPLATLLELQDHDVHAAQLRHRRSHLPERDALAATEEQLAKLEGEARAVGAQRDELATRRDVLDADASEVTARIASIEERMRGGAAASYRDQEAMAGEIGSLARRRGELEDEELVTMEAIEPLESELARLEEERGRLDRDAARTREQLAEAVAAVDAELATSEAARAVLAAAVPPPLLAEFERLAKRLGGVAVARLVHGVCGGCHLRLPATELDRIRTAPAGSVFHCDQCGRILVP